MKRIFISLAVATIFSFFFVSCYYDNEEALYPTLSNACDTANVTFSGTITTLLSNNCYSCHSNSNASFGAGIHLQSFTDVSAYSAKIVAAIKRTGPFPMPLSGKLNTCSVSQFDIWVRNGMPNN
jgi:hypothetical protein